MKRTLAWRTNHLVHNCIAHPLLPLAELFVLFGWLGLAKLIFDFHDQTSPLDDGFNKVTYK